MGEAEKINVRLVRQYDSVLQNCSVFGIIIYSTANVHVKKVLFDRDYSAAIDSLIGEKWPVFSAYINLGDLQKNVPQKTDLSEGKHYLIKEQMTTPESIELLDVFDISSLKKLPVMVVFAADENLDTRKRIFHIDDKDEARVYADLKHIISIVTDSLQQIDYETSGWDKVRFKLDVYRTWTIFSKGKDFILNYILPFIPS